MRVLRIAAFILLVAILPLVMAQSNPGVDPRHDAKPCKLKVVSQGTPDKSKAIQVCKGEKSSGFDPVIAFTILESGEVIGARVKQSSGIADMDAGALHSIRSLKYSNRPGCGVIEAEGSVTIDLR